MVFVGGIFENSNIPNSIFLKKFIESKQKKVGAKKTLKILKTKSKIHLYFRVVHSSIPLLVNKLKSHYFSNNILDLIF